MEAPNVPASSLPQLERLAAPDGAVAAAQQAQRRTSIVYPSGFSDRGMPLAVGKAYVHTPHKDSAIAFKHTFDGFKSANLLATTERSTDLLNILVAEDNELLAAAASPTANAGADNSLKPRRLALWVHVNPELQALHADRLLDAMAHWSTAAVGGDAFIRSMRLTVVGGADSESYARFFGEHCTRPPSDAAWTFRVTMRWVDDKQQRRTETAQLGHVPVSADSALADVQQAAVRLAGTHDAPFPKSLVRSVTHRVPPHAFALATAGVHAEFDALLRAPPHVKLNDATRHCDNDTIENTGVVVRLCEKQLGAGGVNSKTAFHGALLAFGRSKEDAVAFARESAAEDGKLRIPLGAAEEALGLHTCAVQAQRLHLNCCVSLFGLTGIAGKPVNAPHSWVWVECSAIQPVDASLLDRFDVRPCARWSIVPSNAALVEPYKRHFKLCADLFTSLDEHNEPTTIVKNSTFSSISSDETLDAPRLGPAGADDEEAAADARFLLAPFLVDMNSTRATIGEVYGYLADVGAPSNVRKMLALAAGKHGVGASVQALLAMCAESMQKEALVAEAPEVAENARLRCLVEVAVAALVDEPSAPPSKRAKTTTSSVERVRRLLHVVGLKRGGAVQVSRGNWTTKERNVSTRILEALRAPSDGLGSIDHLEIMQRADDIVKAALASRERESEDSWTLRFELAVAQAAGLMLVGTGLSPPPPYFLLTSKRDELRVERFTTRGALEPASLDDVIAATEPSVLIVQKQDGGYRMKVTGTVAIDMKA